MFKWPNWPSDAFDAFGGRPGRPLKGRRRIQSDKVESSSDAEKRTLKNALRK